MQSFILILFYHLPSFTLLILISNYLFYINLTEESNTITGLQKYLMLFTIGLSQSTLGLILNNIFVLGEKTATDSFDFVIITISFLEHWYFNTFEDMLITLIIGGILTTTYHSKKAVHHHFNAKIPKNLLLGKFYLWIFLFLILILTCLKYFLKVENAFLLFIESFYRIGCFTFSRGNAIIPFMLVEFADHINILKGYNLVTLLPGSIFNLASYMGFMFINMFYGFIALFFINLPGLLICLACLPHHKHLIKYQNIHNFFIGVNLASNGFILSAVLHLFDRVCLRVSSTNIYACSLNMLFSFLLLYNFRFSATLTLIIGGISTVIYTLISNIL